MLGSLSIYLVIITYNFILKYNQNRSYIQTTQYFYLFLNVLIAKGPQDIEIHFWN